MTKIDLTKFADNPEDVATRLEGLARQYEDAYYSDALGSAERMSEARRAALNLVRNNGDDSSLTILGAEDMRERASEIRAANAPPAPQQEGERG